MRVVWRWLLPGIVAYVLFLAVNAPATWLAAQLQSRAPAVQLAGVRGSLWSGEADRVNVQGVQLQTLHWRWRPLALFTGRLEFALDGRFQGEAVHSRAGITLAGRPYLRSTGGRLAVQDLVVWFSRAPVELAGTLELDLERVDFPQPGLPVIEGRLVWPQARIVAPLELDLGQVVLTLAPNDGRTRGPLVAQGGRLLVEGELSFDASGMYELEAGLRANGRLPDAVSTLLESLAEYRDGRWYLELSGHIPIP